MLNFEFGTMASGKTETLIEHYITVVNDCKHALIWNSELGGHYQPFFFLDGWPGQLEGGSSALRRRRSEKS